MSLNAVGIGRDDRVAVVLPNGPEMATATLAIAATATCAPLNPSYSADEFDFYFSDLNVKALVIQAGLASPAVALACSRGIAVITLTSVSSNEAGVFSLVSSPFSRECATRFSEPNDLAFLLHTAGTTSRPKIVPLTHRSVSDAAVNIQHVLQLSESDRCLNVMPLFHLHGLCAGFFASLGAGASVVCPAGFDPRQFFEWIHKFRPTWYTAAPAIHRMILADTAATPENATRYPLRFIRSASAALPPTLLAQLEHLFNVPVIESYGLTETASQVTSNPLPPRPRKLGSAGLAAGPEVAIVDTSGQFLPRHHVGEIVVRGTTVMEGYEKNPEANALAFTGEWFRTGDQGFLDADGYLFITGRLKELINRGGEKLSPREIDEILLEHPAIADAATFGIPDRRLGEEIGAAVVLRRGAVATVREIQEFVARRLAEFKVPRHVAIVDEIPKSPTGKLQRASLAESLGLASLGDVRPRGGQPFVAPRTELEKLVARIWGELLEQPEISVHDTFFELGGDSITAAQILSQLRELGLADLTPATFFQSPTVAGLVLTILQGQVLSMPSSDADDVLTALETLSDDDAKHLLAKLRDVATDSPPSVTT